MIISRELCVQVRVLSNRDSAIGIRFGLHKPTDEYGQSGLSKIKTELRYEQVSSITDNRHKGANKTYIYIPLQSLQQCIEISSERVD